MKKLLLICILVVGIAALVGGLRKSKLAEVARGDHNPALESETRSKLAEQERLDARIKKIKSENLAPGQIIGAHTLEKLRIAWGSGVARAPYVLFSEPSGEVTEKAVEDLHLSLGDREKIKKIARDLCQACETEMAKNIEIIPIEKGQQDVLSAWRIRPFEDELVVAFNEYAAALVKEFGIDLAGEMLYQTPQIYNSYGKFDVILQKYMETLDGNAAPMEYLRYDFRDPVSGRSVAKGAYNGEISATRFPMFDSHLNLETPASGVGTAK